MSFTQHPKHFVTNVNASLFSAFENVVSVGISFEALIIQIEESEMSSTIYEAHKKEVIARSTGTGMSYYIFIH